MKTTRTTTLKLIALLAMASLGAVAQKRQEPYALIAGTVFHDSTGRSLPGAKVVLSAKSKPDRKLQEQVSSPSGEFAFRVPPGPASYVISASLKGFEPAAREVEIESQEQIHKTLLLVPASK